MQKKIDQLSLQIQLVEGWKVCLWSIPVSSSKYRPTFLRQAVPHLIDGHFINKPPQTEEKQRLQRGCALCPKHGKKRNYVYLCK